MKPLNSSRVARNYQEYLIPSVWGFLGLLNFILYTFINTQMKYRYIAAVSWLTLAIVNTGLIVYKLLVPIMRTDGKTIVVFPGAFTKKTIEPEKVKTVRIFKYVGTKRASLKQIRKIQTIQIELNDGNVLLLKNVGLVDAVRDKIAAFLQNFNIQLETTNIDQ